MDWFIEAFGYVGSEIGKAIGAFILFLIGILTFGYVGMWIGDGLIWTMKVCRIRNYRIESWIEDNAPGFMWYLIILTVMAMWLF